MKPGVASTRPALPHLGMPHLGMARLGLCAMLACAGLAMTACSATRDTQPANALPDRADPGAGTRSDPIERLRSLAARPSDANREIEPPLPGLRPILPDDDSAAPAYRPLRSLARGDLFQQPTDADAPETAKADPASEDVSPPESKAAILLYAEARLALADGATDRAISLLEKAVTEDPSSPELWRALGDARRAARYEHSAGAAYRRAAALGIREPQALLLAGLNARAQGEPAEGAAWLLEAVRAEPPHTDPLIGYIADATLGESLIELGYTDAGVEALTTGVRMPRAARVPTAVGREAADVQRRLGSLRLMLGDALVRLGRTTEAVGVYEDARGLPGAEGVRERLIYALRTSGNDAGAAIVLLDELVDGAPVSPETSRLLSELAAQIRPRTLVAEALASIDDRGSASRRAELVVAQAGARRPQDALNLLARTLSSEHAFSSPSLRTLLRAGIESPALADAGDRRRAIRWLTNLIERTPWLAQDAAAALIITPGLPAGLPDLIADSGVDADRSAPLLAELALIQRNTKAVRSSLAQTPETSGRAAPSLQNAPADAARTAALGASVGDWELVEQSIGALRGLDAPRALARALNAAQRPDEALRVLRGLEPRTVDDLLTRSALESAVGSPENALAELEAARDLDPLDERVYAALLSFHSPDGPGPDDDAVTATGRQLRRLLPESGLLRTMLAGELLRRRLVDDAAAITIPLFLAEPTDPARQDAVLQLWRARTGMQQHESNEIDTVRAVASTHANDPGLTRLLAGGLVLSDEPDEAESVLTAFTNATGDETLASLREQIIRDGLDDPDRAEAIAIERLGRNPRSIGASVELLSLHADAAARGDASHDRFAAMEQALRAIPRSATLNTQQRESVVRSIARAAIVIDTARRRGDNTEASRDPLLGMLSLAADRDLAVAPGIHELRLVLLDERGEPAPALLRAAEYAADQQAEGTDLRRAFLRRAVDLLVARGEAEPAFAWLRSRALATSAGSDAQNEPNGTDEPAPHTGTDLDSDAIQEWFRLVIVTGQTDPDAAYSRAQSMLDALHEAGGTKSAWNIVRPDGPSWSAPSLSAVGEELPKTEPEISADLAYLFALYAPDPNGTSDARTRYLRLALAYDPAHPWAANDLGYTILEAGGDLAEAERLIEIAYAGNPDEANIVDSLGWVRYHRGKIEDSTDPDTGTRTLGAVSLLQRAVELSGPTDDGVVDDHLGDALYAAGRTEDAITAWRRSARLANAALSRMRATGRIDGVRSEDIADLAVRAIMKPNAIQLGQPPAVEPQRGISTPGTDHLGKASIEGDKAGRETRKENALDDE